MIFPTPSPRLRAATSLAALTCVAAPLLAPVPVEAGGYELRQQGAGAVATSVAGSTAGGHGLPDVFFNPAVAGLVEAPTGAVSGSVIAADSDVTRASGQTVFGQPTGSGAAEDVMPPKLIPALYLAAPIDDRVTVGFAVNAPFGLETDHPDDWAGRYQALNTEVTAISAGPVASLRVADGVWLGGSVYAQHYRGRLSNALDFATLGTIAGVPGLTPGGALDGRAEVDADDWAPGFRLGALIEPWSGGRLGVGYRSEVSHDLDGTVDFTGDALGLAAQLRQATGMFTDGGVSAKVRTPRSVSIGLSQDVTPRLTVLGELQWIDWSTFDALVVRYDNPAQQPTTERHDWRDGWFGSVGARYAVSADWTLSAGMAHDRSPVPDSTRGARIPDADRTWVSAGAAWRPADGVALEIGYAHLFMPEVGISGSGGGSSFRARSHTDVDIVSVQLTLQF